MPYIPRQSQRLASMSSPIATEIKPPAYAQSSKQPEKKRLGINTISVLKHNVDPADILKHFQTSPYAK